MTAPSEPRVEGTKDLSQRMTTADVVRAKGWGVGTRLTGDEGHGPTVIEITAVGEAMVLAKAISSPGGARRETSWILSNREWIEVPQPASNESSHP